MPRAMERGGGQLRAPPGSREPRRRARTLAQTAAALQGGMWAPADALIAGLSILVAHQLSPVYAGDVIGREALWAAGVYGVAFVLVAYGVGLYEASLWPRRTALFLRCVASAALASGATLAFFYLVFYRPIGRWVVAGAVAATTALVFLPREGLRGLLRHRPRRILFVHQSELAERMIAALKAEPLYEVVGSWPEPLPRRASPSPSTAEPEDLVEVCRARDVDELVLAATAMDLKEVLLPAMRCLPLGCRVRSEAEFHEDIFRAVPLLGVTPEWMLSRGWDTSNHPAEAAKRVTDVVLAVLILVGLAPFALVAMLLIKLTSGRPVFYTQVRVGRYGRPFRILKFRTMRVGAEDGQPQWSPCDDPRRTPIGRILRRMRIDELPQVLNVFRGDMSFVGPRPERPEFVESLERGLPYYSWRHLVRPGLTGWAQINCPYGSTIDDARKKLEYDLYYIRHASLATDLAIVLRTVTAGMRGAR